VIIYNNYVRRMALPTVNDIVLVSGDGLESN